MNINPRAYLILITAILSACSTLPSTQTTDERTHSDNKAVLQLLSSAYEHRQQGEHERSIAKLERALRLEPSNATLWLELAKSNQQQGNQKQALSLAQRAQSLAIDSNIKDDVRRFLNSIEY